MQLWYFTLRVQHNEADVVISARLEGKFGRIFLWNTQRENVRNVKVSPSYIDVQIVKRIDDGFGQIYE